MSEARVTTCKLSARRRDRKWQSQGRWWGSSAHPAGSDCAGAPTLTRYTLHSHTAHAPTVYCSHSIMIFSCIHFLQSVFVNSYLNMRQEHVLHCNHAVSFLFICRQITSGESICSLYGDIHSGQLF